MKNKEGFWMEDQNMDRDEVDAVNAALEEASKVDPRWSKLIWNKK